MLSGYNIAKRDIEASHRYPERVGDAVKRDFSSKSNKKYKSKLGGAWS